MKQPVKLKLKSRSSFVEEIQNFIIRKEVSNSPLISMRIHYACRKFARELEKLYLSDELQDL